MPEQIRLKVGSVGAGQMIVYEEFARNIPGFLPLSERDSALLVPKATMQIEVQAHSSTPFQMTQYIIAADCAENGTNYEKLAMEADQFVQATSTSSGFALVNSNMQVVRDCLINGLHNREIASVVTIIQKVCRNITILKCSSH